MGNPRQLNRLVSIPFTHPLPRKTTAKKGEVGSGKGEGELLQEFSPGYSCYRNHLRSISAPPLYKEICSPLIAGKVKWFTRKCRHSAPAHPWQDGSSSASASGDYRCLQLDKGLPCPRGRTWKGRCALCICKEQQRWSEDKWPVVESLWRGRMRRSQEIVTEITTCKGSSNRASVCKLWKKWSRER